MMVGPGGGIGRRARLRIWWSNPCGFESLSGHCSVFLALRRVKVRAANEGGEFTGGVASA
jgi:hypothetical protein